MVSNTDVEHTYSKLLDHVTCRHWTNSQLKNIHQSMSCFLLNLGVRRKYPQLSHHTTCLGPRYKGLVQGVFDLEILPDDLGMYLHVPSRTEPAVTPSECESIYVLVPMPNLASGIGWGLTTGLMTDRVISAPEKWGLEDLRTPIEVQHVFTPNDFEPQFNSTLGNAFGIEPRITQTAWFRPRNRSKDVLSLPHCRCRDTPRGRSTGSYSIG